jgi:hypothetical protein
VTCPVCESITGIAGLPIDAVEHNLVEAIFVHVPFHFWYLWIAVPRHTNFDEDLICMECYEMVFFFISWLSGYEGKHKPKAINSRGDPLNRIFRLSNAQSRLRSFARKPSHVSLSAVR